MGEANPENHRRRTISIVMEDVDENVRGLLNANRHRHAARLVLEHLDRPVVDGEVLVVREGQGGRGQPMRCSLMGGLFVLLATRTIYQQLLLGIVYLKILILVVTF